MKIAGLQKLTLLDYPGYTACTVFLAGCNFRCPFCHNAEIAFLPLTASEEKDNPVPVAEGTYSSGISTTELLAFLKKRQGLLDGVCITGGEPTLWPELPELIQQIKDLDYLIKLDTNGTNPALLEELLDKNLLDYIAMDIKAGPDNYTALTGIRMNLDNIKTSAELIRNWGKNYEFRTTVVSPLHSEQDFLDIAHWLRGARAYYLQPFVLSDMVPNRQLRPPSDAELQRYLNILRPLIPAAAVRGRS